MFLVVEFTQVMVSRSHGTERSASTYAPEVDHWFALEVDGGRGAHVALVEQSRESFPDWLELLLTKSLNLSHSHKPRARPAPLAQQFPR
jgi:hypothetical protein